MTLSTKTENSKVKSHVVRVGLRWMLLNFSTGGRKKKAGGGGEHKNFKIKPLPA